MLEFERLFSQVTPHGIVASESRKLSAEERQRDVFESHRHRVYAVSYYMTANEQEAETILTETFVSAFLRDKEPDAHTLDMALLVELERRFSLDPVEPASPDPALMLSRAATHRTDMEEAVAELPPSERLVFLLKDVEGYPASRIARLLGMPEMEVQRTILSARIRMRNALGAAYLAAAKARKPSPEEEEDTAEYRSASV